MWWGTDTESAYQFVIGLMGWILNGLDERTRDGACAELRRAIEQHAGSGGVEFDSAAWLVTASRP
jgi:hypothetical protein